MKRLCLLVMCFFNITLLYGESDPYRELPKSLVAYPLNEPPPLFKGNGSFYVAYELFVNNFSHETLTIVALVAKGLKDDKQVYQKQYVDQSIDTLFARAGSKYSTPQRPELKPGESGILFLFLEFTDQKEIPTHINHDISIQFGHTIQHVKIEPFKVNNQPPIVISGPVAGEKWWVPNGPSDSSAHRRSVTVLDGQLCFPQTYAVDLVQFDNQGLLFSGDSRVNDSYYCYGKFALAVADAEVVQIKDGVKENVPGGYSLDEPLELETLMGNYVLLKLKEDLYALYAHLIPGSLEVKVGQKVKTGDIIGLIGNSGNSSAPHLHFHLSTKPKHLIGEDEIYPLFAKGIPFAIDSFELVEYFVKNWYEDDLPEQIEVQSEQKIKKEMLMNENLVNFSSPIKQAL